MLIVGGVAFVMMRWRVEENESRSQSALGSQQVSGRQLEVDDRVADMFRARSV